jgi:hypothetical protein
MLQKAAKGIFGMRSVSTLCYIMYGQVNRRTESTFRSLLEEYLASIDNSKIHTLEDLVEFNNKHAEQELSSGMLPLAVHHWFLTESSRRKQQPGWFY